MNTRSSHIQNNVGSQRRSQWHPRSNEFSRRHPSENAVVYDQEATRRPSFAHSKRKDLSEMSPRELRLFVVDSVVDLLNACLLQEKPSPRSSHRSSLRLSQAVLSPQSIRKCTHRSHPDTSYEYDHSDEKENELGVRTEQKCEVKSFTPRRDSRPSAYYRRSSFGKPGRVRSSSDQNDGKEKHHHRMYMPVRPSTRRSYTDFSAPRTSDPRVSMSQSVGNGIRVQRRSIRHPSGNLSFSRSCNSTVSRRPSGFHL